MLEKLSKVGKIGVNVNGDLPEENIRRLSEELSESVKIIWIGDNPLFQSPFEVARIVSDCFDHLIGFGVLTPRWSVEKIYGEIKNLEREYGERYVLGVASGKSRLRDFEKFLEKLKEKFDEFLCGVTWKKSYEIAKKYCSGLLINHVHPKHLSAFEDFEGFKAAYGPALVLPSEFYQDLIIASAIVMRTSKGFLEEYGYISVYESVRDIDIEALIKKRQEGLDLEHDGEFKKLKKVMEDVIEFFTISGSFESVSERISDLLRVCDHVVLGDPFFRDKKSAEHVSLLLSRLGLS